MTHNPKSLRSETTLRPWFIWLVAVAFYGYEFLQRVSISVYLPFLLPSLKTTVAGIGIMSAFYYYAYASMQIPAGMLIDRFGPKRLSIFGAFLVSVGALLFGMIDNVYMGGAARFLIGLGSAFAFICCMQFIIIWFPLTRFALLAGLTNLAGYLGATAGEVPLTEYVHRFGWRNATIVASAFGVVLIILMFAILRDQPFRHKHKHRSVKQHAPSIFEGLRHVLKDMRNWLNGIYALLMVGPTSAFAALWGVTFLVHVDHLHQEVAAGALSAIFIGVAMGSPLFGWFSDKIGKRQPLLIFAALGSLVATLILIFLNQIPLTVIYACCFVFGFMQSAHVLNFAKARDINPRRYSGTAMGYTNMMTMLGGAILQPLVGLLLAYQKHTTIHSTAIYSHNAYHVALLAIPASQFIALLLAIFCLKDLRAQ